jgi:hypothetical protein
VCKFLDFEGLIMMECNGRDYVEKKAKVWGRIFGGSERVSGGQWGEGIHRRVRRFGVETSSVLREGF